ncbi:MAG: hypothetical protein RBS73_15080 [Prolixibacteraceae bacterium]|nr:hypothetical protein [Prolixibacteraceae bacterium]
MKKTPEDKKFETLIAKSTIKQLAYKNVFDAFGLIKTVLKELVEEYHDALKGKVDDEVLPVFLEKGVFEAEFKIGGDLLIFSMHSNIFVFDRDHPIWKTEYVKTNGANSYCGVINIYNFLADSFKYNRMEDLGYLIARVFINWENHFFVQGKRQTDEVVKDFVKDTMNKEILRKIIETSIQYAIDFDLLVPPYDTVKIASVEQMMVAISHSKIQTGKRLGFKFNSDDV